MELNVSEFVLLKEHDRYLRENIQQAWVHQACHHSVAFALTGWAPDRYSVNRQTLIRQSLAWESTVPARITQVGKQTSPKENCMHRTRANITMAGTTAK